MTTSSACSSGGGAQQTPATCSPAARCCCRCGCSGPAGCCEPTTDRGTHREAEEAHEASRKRIARLPRPHHAAVQGGPGRAGRPALVCGCERKPTLGDGQLVQVVVAGTTTGQGGG